MGGGGFQMEPDNPLLDDHVLALARERSGRRPAADLPDPDRDAGRSGADRRLRAAVRAARAEPRVLRLFARDRRRPRRLVLGAGRRLRRPAATPPTCSPCGGFTGWTGVLREAWEAGVVHGRDVGRGDLLVRGLHDGLVRPDAPAAPRRARASSPAACARTTTAKRSAGRSTAGSSADGDAAGRLRRRRRRGARLPRTASSSRS